MTFICPMCNGAPGDQKLRNKGFFETFVKSKESKNNNNNNKKGGKKRTKNNNESQDLSFSYHCNCYPFKKDKYKGVGEKCPVTGSEIVKVHKLDKDFEIIQFWDEKPEVRLKKKEEEEPKTVKSEKKPQKQPSEVGNVTTSGPSPNSKTKNPNQLTDQLKEILASVEDSPTGGSSKKKKKKGGKNKGASGVSGVSQSTFSEIETATQESIPFSAQTSIKLEKPPEIPLALQDKKSKIQPQPPNLTNNSNSNNFVNPEYLETLQTKLLNYENQMSHLSKKCCELYYLSMYDENNIRNEQLKDFFDSIILEEDNGQKIFKKSYESDFLAKIGLRELDSESQKNLSCFRYLQNEVMEMNKDLLEEVIGGESVSDIQKRIGFVGDKSFKLDKKEKKILTSNKSKEGSPTSTAPPPGLGPPPGLLGENPSNHSLNNIMETSNTSIFDTEQSPKIPSDPTADSLFNQVLTKLKKLYPQKSPFSLKMRIEKLRKDLVGEDKNFRDLSLDQLINKLSDELNSEISKEISKNIELGNMRRDQNNNNNTSNKIELLEMGDVSPINRKRSEDIFLSSHEDILSDEDHDISSPEFSEQKNLFKPPTRRLSKEEKKSIVAPIGRRKLDSKFRTKSTINAQDSQTSININPWSQKSSSTNNAWGTDNNNNQSVEDTGQTNRSRSNNNNNNSSKSSPDPKCVICLEEFNQIDFLDQNINKLETCTTCTHTFHKKCLADWKKIDHSCPLCKKIKLDDTDYPVLGMATQRI